MRGSGDDDAVVGPPARELDRRSYGSDALAADGTHDATTQVLLKRALDDIDGLLMPHTDNPELRFTAASAPWFFPSLVAIR